MTAAAKKIKTYVFVITDSAIPHGTTIDTVKSWVLERNITIIGALVNTLYNVVTTELAELGGYKASAEITRAAIPAHHSSIAVVNQGATWSAAGDCPISTATESIMFPDGNAIDIDDGESVNFITSHASRQAALNTMIIASLGIVYYLDR